MIRKTLAALRAYRGLAAIRVRMLSNQLRRASARPPVQPTLGEQWRSVIAASPESIRPRINPGRDNRPVVFAPLWAGTSMVNKALESVMAHALVVRGVPVRILGCGKALRACVPDPWGNRQGACGSGGPTTPPICPSCAFTLSDIYKGSGLRLDFLAQYFRASDHEEADALVAQMDMEQAAHFVHDGVSLGEHALASALRATGRGLLDPDNPGHLLLLRRQLAATLVLSRAAARYFAEVRPSRLVLMHGIYADHGTLGDCAKRAGIPITVFTRPYRKNTLMLCHGDTYHRALIDEPVSLWENREPPPALRRRLLDYVESRRTGSQDSVTYHPNPTVGRAAIFDGLGLEEGKPVVSLFTNVMWDASLFHKGSAFPNMLDWLFATIEHYSAHPEIQLVIRVHPAEVKAVKKSLQPVADEIRRRYPMLPRNIHVVPPESDLSSYDLVESSAAAIVYGTKMALEIVLRGTPTLVAGESFVRGKGFTLDASTPDEYAAMLQALHLAPRLDAAKLERARRYAEHFFFRRQIDFSLVKENTRSEPALNFTDLGSLRPGKSAALDAICAGLVDGSEILAPDAND